MKVKWRKLIKATTYCLLNPHLLLLGIFGLLVWCVWNSLYFLADKLDDAARSTRKFDVFLGSKEYPSWFNWLITPSDK